ncbi:preprotein translocase subunit YajC [Murdochiella massiliensis]|uniref:preprotein translocase subunit YajC n=1 Tax=Murdochiella massiliensis TaxID=1673723 RepID=UPI00096AD878|nr:preprotein translocase subunit YajC [Murdochiella massiliensis]
MPNNWYAFAMLAVMFGAMYFLMIRPQKKRQEEMAKVRDNLKIGDTVVTIGGIRGNVVALSEDAFEIETGRDHHRMEFLRNALSYVVQPVDGYEKQDDTMKWEGEESTDAEVPQEAESEEHIEQE